MATNHGGDPLGSILGPMGSHWVQKIGHNRKNLPCAKIRIFDYPAVIDFLQKMEVTDMATNHGGDPLGSILGPMGVQKMGQNRKKLPYPKIRIFDYPAIINFLQKMEATVMVPSHGGDPVGSILGPMGSHWVQKRVKTIKDYHAPKCEFSTTLRSSISCKKWKLRLWWQITVGTPRVHFGVNGVPLGPKVGQNHKKLPCAKIRIFDYPAVIDFLQKMVVTVMATNYGGDPLGSILGSMGSYWVQKNGSKAWKLRCPKIRIFYYPAIIDFSPKWKLRLWRQITVGTP